MTYLLLALPLLLVVLRYNQPRRRKDQPALTLFNAAHCCAINRSKHRLNLAPRHQLPPITPEDHL